MIKGTQASKKNKSTQTVGMVESLSYMNWVLFKKPLTSCKLPPYFFFI